jgi:uncharacterized protein YggE
MNHKLMHGVWIVVVIIFLTLICFFVPWKMVHWGTVALAPAGTVTVTGYAESKEKNQIATFTAGVSVTKDNKEAATAEVNTKIKAIIEAANEFGIKAEDIKTEYINVYQNQEQYYEDNRQKTRPGQWNVSNSASFILRDVARAGSFADTLSRAGATNVNGPQFSMDNTHDIENALLGNAISDARKKAELVAKAAGKKLKGIVSVAEGASSGQVFPMFREGGGGGGGGLQPGTGEVTKSVTVVFEMK